MVEPIKNAVFNLFNDIVNGNTGTLIAEIGLPSEIAEGKQRSCISSGKPLYRAQVG
jgi:hypothetical protein